MPNKIKPSAAQRTMHKTMMAFRAGYGLGLAQRPLLLEDVGVPIEVLREKYAAEAALGEQIASWIADVNRRQTGAGDVGSGVR